MEHGRDAALNMVWKAEPTSFARLQQTAAGDATPPTTEQLAPESAPAEDEGDCTPSLLTGELICGIGDGSPPQSAP